MCDGIRNDGDLIKVKLDRKMMKYVESLVVNISAS